MRAFSRSVRPKLMINLLIGSLSGLMLGALHGCGGAGKAEATDNSGLPVDVADVVGSIGSLAGGQSQMSGWVVALIERDTNLARVGEVDQAGIFSLKHVNMAAAHTVILVSPDYVLQSVLSMPGTKEKTIKQFFTMSTKTLPRLIHKGPVVNFQDTNNISPTREIASDEDGDGIPDGTKSFSLGTNARLNALTALDAGEGQSFGLTGTTREDTDRDATPNYADPDIDGDGVPNVVDPDDDGDGILDAIDLDSNGDLVQDSAQTYGELYHSVGTEFVATQFESVPQDDGSTKSTLQFTTRVRDSVQPLAVQMRGPPSLFNSANIETVDTAGQPTVIKWDKLLLDDGQSGDASVNDRLFSRKVTLETGKSPRSHQVMFFQLAFGKADSPWFLEYPYTFPPVSLGSVTSAYDKTTQTVQLVGSPFGSLTDYIWSVVIYNSEQTKIWESPTVKGVEKTFVLPSNILETGATYQYSVVAQLLDRIPGYPSFLVRSKKYEIAP